eukprot:1186834-Prorocentrum_minimum.AAC.13
MFKLFTLGEAREPFKRWSCNQGRRHQGEGQPPVQFQLSPVCTTPLCSPWCERENVQRLSRHETSNTLDGDTTGCGALRLDGLVDKVPNDPREEKLALAESARYLSCGRDCGQSFV